MKHREIADLILEGFGARRCNLENPVSIVLDMGDINDAAQLIFDRLIVVNREADIERFKI